jgi:hypothetical protein
MVEQSCLSAISTFGLNYGNIHWGPTPATILRARDVFQALMKNVQYFSFLTTHACFKNIDTLYLRVEQKKNMCCTPTLRAASISIGLVGRLILKAVHYPQLLSGL